VTTAGEGYCWGSGALGPDAPYESAIPHLISGDVTFVGVTTGYGHACGVTAETTVVCWGSNLRSQLGGLGFHP